jgi:hypothetical protein
MLGQASNLAAERKALDELRDEKEVPGGRVGGHVADLQHRRRPAAAAGGVDPPQERVGRGEEQE